MNLVHKIDKPLHIVFLCLTNMQNFAFVHPVITKIISSSPQEYLVYETLRMGFISVSFRYPVTISPNVACNMVEMKAVVMKLTTIEIKFELKREGALTVVEETIHFKSILPVKRTMEKIFRKQHVQLFQNIGNL